MNKNKAIIVILIVLVLGGIGWLLFNNNFNNNVQNNEDIKNKDQANTTTTKSDSTDKYKSTTTTQGSQNSQDSQDNGKDFSFDVINNSTSSYNLDIQLPKDAVGSETVRIYIQEQLDKLKNNSQSQDTQNKISESTKTEVYKTDKLVSYKVVTTREGGATSDIRVEAFVYDKDGNELDGEELIARDKYQDFLDATQNKVYDKYNVDASNPNNPFSAIENLLIDDLKLYIKEDNIHVVFPKYEIGPGAAGVIDIALSVDTYLASEFK